MLEIEKKPQLGSGENVEGEVYDYYAKPDQIIKKYTNVNFERKELQYKIMNKYPDIFVKVFKITPKYVVLEKLKLPITDIEELQKFTSENNTFIKGGDRLKNVYNSDVVFGIYQELKTGKTEILTNLIKQAKKEKREYLVKLLLKIYKVLNTLKKKLPQVNRQDLDIHTDNIGEDSKGNLKLFDIGIE